MTVMTDAQTGTDAATLPRAERAIGLFVAGLRLATLAQMLPSLVAALDQGEHRALTAVTWAAGQRDGAGHRGRAWCDAAHRVRRGRAWTPPSPSACSSSGSSRCRSNCARAAGSASRAPRRPVACSLVGVRDVRIWGTLVGALVAARAVYVLPIISTAADVPTVVGELFTMLGLAPLAWFGVGTVLRIAQDADESRAYAARLPVRTRNARPGPRSTTARR